MVLTPSGEVLTNNHVVLGTTKISVTDIGKAGRIRRPSWGTTAPATSRCAAAGASGLQTVPLGNSSTAAVRDRVTALGNAGGTGGTPRWRVARSSPCSKHYRRRPGGGNAQRLKGSSEPTRISGPATRRTPHKQQRPGDRHERGVVGRLHRAALRYQGTPSRSNEAVAISRQIEAGAASAPCTWAHRLSGRGDRSLGTAWRRLWWLEHIAALRSTRGRRPGWLRLRRGPVEGDVITTVKREGCYLAYESQRSAVDS